MVFEINGKVVLVTGGASGIGFQCSKEFLRNGAKGVTLADISKESGEKALQEIEKEFGPNRAIFLQTDVTVNEEFERAFKRTVEEFGSIDIVHNNAGIFNEKHYRRVIDVNLTGVVTGCLLAIEKYLPKYMQGDEGLVIISASVAGTEPVGGAFPVYIASKHALIGLTKSWGYFGLSAKTKVRVVAICPGFTTTELAVGFKNNVFGQKYFEMYEEIPPFAMQGPKHVARETIEVVKYAPSGTCWVIEGDEPAYQYETPHRSTMKENRLEK